MATTMWQLENGQTNKTKRARDRFCNVSPIFASFRLFLQFFSLVFALSGLSGLDLISLSFFANFCAIHLLPSAAAI